MNHQQAQDSFLDLVDGLLSRSDEEQVLAHLSACGSCRGALEDYRLVVALQHRLASEVVTLERGFGGAVMQLIDQEEARAEVGDGIVRRRVSDHSEESTILTPFARKGLVIVAAASALGLLTFALTPHSCPLPAHGADTYCEAVYEDSFARWAVGNLFELIEGSFGAILMVSFFLAAIISFFLPRRTTVFRHAARSGGFLTMASMVFCLRAVVSLFFGTSYSDYSDGGSLSSKPSSEELFEALKSDIDEQRGAALDSGPQDLVMAFKNDIDGQEKDRQEMDRVFRQTASDPTRPTVSVPLSVNQYGSFRESPVTARELNERYASTGVTGWKSPQTEPVSTFAIDVDTGSYTNLRRYLVSHRLPPVDAIRVEELVNYFTYSYPAPSNGPFSVSMELAPSPTFRTSGDPVHLLQIGIKAKEAPRDDRGWNLVFLIDVSGSMADPNKLPLLKVCLKMLAQQLRAQDRLAIVTYADTSAVVLESTSGREKERISRVIDGLTASGGTNGEAGIQAAYSIALQNRIAGGVNKVVLATDGDFNVGTSSLPELITLIQERKSEGVSLSTLGLGTGNLKEDNLEQLADRGDGSYFYIDEVKEAERIFTRKLAATIEDIAKDVKIQLELNPARVKSYRLLGFQNRVLSEAEFADDSADGGEIGSGHTVTALYELILKPEAAAKSTHPEELGFFKLRFKDLTGSGASQLEIPVILDEAKSRAPSQDFRFAAAVAAFGSILRNEDLAHYNLQQVKQVAQESESVDRTGERSEFVTLIDRAIALREGPAAALRRYQQ